MKFKVGDRVKLKDFKTIETPYFGLSKDALKQIENKEAIIVKDLGSKWDHIYEIKGSFEIQFPFLVKHNRTYKLSVPSHWLIHPINDKINKILSL